MVTMYPSGLQTCRMYANYARALVAEHTGSGARVKSAPDIPLDVKGEIATVIGRILEAWHNKVYLSYSFDEVIKALEEPSRNNKEDSLREKFRGPSGVESGGTQLHDTPCIFVDTVGHIVTTYLPGCFTQRRSKQILQAVQSTAQYPNSIIRIQKSENWRDNHDSYANPSKCLVGPGLANLSICWFQQGHGPSNSLPQVSASLCENRVNQGGEDLLAQLTEVNALIGAVLAVIHPDLFDRQLEILETLSRGEVEVGNLQLMQNLFRHWSTPFNGVAVIANRETALHRDIKGGRKLLDIVATFGRYQNGRFEVPLLGSRFIYNPGTCIALPGFAFEHGASRTDGERVCLASFIRPNVGEAALGSYGEYPLPMLDRMFRYHGLESPEVVGRDIWH